MAGLFFIVLIIVSCNLSHQEHNNYSLPLQVLADKTTSVNGTCSSPAMAQTRSSVQNQVSTLLHDRVVPYLRSHRPPACACGGPGEWTRIAHLNMSDPSQHCPANWTLITTPNNIRVCVGISQSTPACDSVRFLSNGLSYSHVCGRVIAYQKGTTDAFLAFIVNSTINLENAYLDGISVTHGAAGSRQHIWSFAAAVYESSAQSSSSKCSCSDTGQNWPYQVPSFIDSNYFCDSGNPGPMSPTQTYYEDDPLWDGAGCGRIISTCCSLNNPPWFCTTLPQPTTDDIELRNCRDEPTNNEDILVALVEIYVK